MGATMSTDTMLENLGAQRLVGEEKRHQHKWVTDAASTSCCWCPAVRDPVETRKGRNARARGNAFEVEVARKLKRVLFTERVGQYGRRTDVRGSLAVIQCKKDAALFPSRIDRLLREVEDEADADQFPMVALSNVPGPGGTLHELLVMDLNDFANLLDVIAESGDR